MSISVTDLHKMVDLCMFYFESIDMKINVGKSVCMRIGTRHKVPVNDITIQNQPIIWKCEFSYLGVSFVSANSLKCNLQSVRHKFFRALNGIFSKIGLHASPMVTLSLIDSYCMPLLSYGIEAFNVTQSMYNSLESAFTAAFAKIFRTYDKTIIRSCQFYCGVLPFVYRLDLIRLNFYAGLSRTTNSSLKGLFLQFGCKEFSKLLKKYDLSASDSTATWKKTIWKHFTNSVMHLAEI